MPYQFFKKLFFQTQKNVHQSFITSNQRKQQTNILEETYAEDAMVQEQVAQEIIIRGRKITHIAAGPYDGYLEGPLQATHGTDMNDIWNFQEDFNF